MLWRSGLLGWFLEQDCWLCGVTYLSTTSLSLMPLNCHCCMSNILYSNVATHMFNFTLDHFGLATSVTSFLLSSLTDFASIPHHFLLQPVMIHKIRQSTWSLGVWVLFESLEFFALSSFVLSRCCFLKFY